MKRFLLLFLMVFSFGVIGLGYNAQASEVVYKVSTESELKDALKKYRYSWDDTSIRLQDNIIVSGDLDLGNEPLTLDLNYHSLSFINSDNGLTVHHAYSWTKINIKNGFIFGADNSHSAFNPRDGEINITNVSIYGGKNVAIRLKVDMQYH